MYELLLSLGDSRKIFLKMMYNVNTFSSTHTAAKHRTKIRGGKKLERGRLYLLHFEIRSTDKCITCIDTKN